MKAIECTQFGGPEVLKLAEMPRPVPKKGEILVRVRATAVNYGDLTARNFKSVSPQEFHMLLLLWVISKFYFGLTKPRIRILGSEFAGEVEAVGEGVTRFQVGEPVFGYLGQSMGAYAEWICVPEDGVVTHKPANLSFAEAAVIPYGAIMALNLLQKAAIQPGHKVLILGASGGIGSAAVQIARQMGAEVTGVCGAPRMNFVKALGAARVLDYQRDDFTQMGEKYDLILDVLGKSTFSRCKRVLKPHGLYLRASFKLKQLLEMFGTAFSNGPKVICAMAPGSLEDLEAVKELAETGALKAIVEVQFPLEQAAEAHRYMESGSRKGNVAITLFGDAGTYLGDASALAKSVAG